MPTHRRPVYQLHIIRCSTNYLPVPIKGLKQQICLCLHNFYLLTLHTGRRIDRTDVVFAAWLWSHDRSDNVIDSQRRWPTANHRRRHSRSSYVCVLSSNDLCLIIITPPRLAELCDRCFRLFVVCHSFVLSVSRIIIIIIISKTMFMVLSSWQSVAWLVHGPAVM